MRTLVLADVDKNSGKTVVALGLALNHPGRVQYIKPIRGELVKVEHEVYERDARLVQTVLSLEGEDREISPVDLEVSGRAEAGPIYERMRSLAESSDLLIVETGQSAEVGMCQGLSAFDVCEALGAGMVLVTDSDPCLLDSILLLRDYASRRGVAVEGVIVNNDTDGAMASLLQRFEVPVLGTLPFQPRLKWFHVREILEHVGGECVAGSKGLDRMVANVVIGAMTASTALPIMRRIPAKCVITGGDRSDLQLAALTTDTSCLVLTGGLRPDSQVMAEAHDKEVPVIVIGGDTYSVSERFDHLETRINPEDRELIDLVRELIRDNLDLERLFGQVP